MTQRDVVHLGVMQALVFDNVHENIGNGYNNVSGTFIAPVPGTYVFHVTICGHSANADSHSYANLLVNGAAKASFIIMPYDQSSQMVVTTLNMNDVIMIKNLIPNDGVIGTTFSSFSGFLLYENESIAQIIG